jgi:phosphoenolpyruvate-protein kinase (PTS system EI component)
LSLQSLKNLAVSAVMTTALGAAMLVTVPQSYADDHAKCQRQIEKEEAKLDQAIRKHGGHSRQAEQRRRDLNAERERCWNAYHGWWDGHEHRWHDDRDWDRH